MNTQKYIRPESIKFIIALLSAIAIFILFSSYTDFNNACYWTIGISTLIVSALSLVNYVKLKGKNEVWKILIEIIGFSALMLASNGSAYLSKSLLDINHFVEVSWVLGAAVVVVMLKRYWDLNNEPNK